MARMTRYVQLGKDELFSMDPALKDKALRRDINYLGTKMGEVFHQQAGAKAYQLEEKIRLAAKKLRGSQDVRVLRDLEKVIRGKDLATLRLVVKAFTIYFQLVN